MQCARSCGCRCLVKPLKRWAYARGRAFTNRYMTRYLRKYLVKWLKKWRKVEEAEGVAGAEFPSSRREAVVSALLASLAVGERTLPRREALVAAVAAVLDRADGGSSAGPAALFADYTLGLKKAVDCNIGLDHSKVREYWFNRGPRLWATMFFFCAFSITVQEMVHVAEEEHGAAGVRTTWDRVYTVVMAAMALLISTFMLYFRLPDSIEASIARAAHDYYRAEKGRIPARVLEGMDGQHGPPRVQVVVLEPRELVEVV